MKIHLLFFALFLLFGASRCENKDRYELGQAFRLQLGGTAQCRCRAPVIQFTAIKEDSRCPEYANCIWEGQAVIQFSLEAAERRQVDLALRAGHPELASKKIGDYIYRLEKVTPYPQTGKEVKPEEYIVELVVEGI